jgi:hypothetical protein
LVADFGHLSVRSDVKDRKLELQLSKMQNYTVEQNFYDTFRLHLKSIQLYMVNIKFGGISNGIPKVCYLDIILLIVDYSNIKQI